MDINTIVKLEAEQLKRVVAELDNPLKATHLLYRISGPLFQEKFATLKNVDSIPRLFIHGNPHLDNYVRCFNGAGMVDYDRSRIGPYAWDLIRFVGSLSILSDDPFKLPKKDVLNEMMRGFERSFLNPDQYFSTPLFMKTKTPSADELTIKNYQQANLKWSKKMRKNPMDPQSKKIQKLIELYFKGREEEETLKYFEVLEAGRSMGSLGKEHILILMTPKDQREKRDQLFIDIKETYQEADNDLFYKPTEHSGERMVKASLLYAPGVEQGLSFFTYKGDHYWGREVPSFSVKVKEVLARDEQRELAYHVGCQLGRAHRRSFKGKKPKAILQDWDLNQLVYLDFVKFMLEEVEDGLSFIQGQLVRKDRFARELTPVSY